MIRKPIKANPDAAKIIESMLKQILIIMVNDRGGTYDLTVKRVDEEPKDYYLTIRLFDDEKTGEKTFQFITQKK